MSWGLLPDILCAYCYCCMDPSITFITPCWKDLSTYPYCSDDRIVAPKKVCACPNLWNLWTWPYLDKGFLQIELRISKWNYPGLPGPTLNLMPRVLIKDRKVKTQLQRKSLCEDEGRDWSYTATSQGTPKATKTGRGQNGSSPTAFWERIRPCQLTLISGPRNCEKKKKFCSFKTLSLWYVICYSSLKKLVHIPTFQTKFLEGRD